MSVLSPILGQTLRPLVLAMSSALAGGHYVPILDEETAELAPYVTFTRASTATRYNSAGLLETVAANQPRYDYDPVTLQLRGLLIEEQRTNQFLNTENFTAAPWERTVGGTSTRTNLSGARGFGIGLITATSASGGIRQRLTGLVSGQQYSLSFYMESTATDIWVALENGEAAYGTACTVVINPTTGAVSSQVGFTRVTSTPLDAGRIFTIILPAAAGALTANIEWRLPNGASMRFGIPQFEPGAFATSYIPTTTAAVTRAADDAAILSIASIGFNPSEGSLFVEYTPNAPLATIPSAASFIGAGPNGFNIAGGRARWWNGSTNVETANAVAFGLSRKEAFGFTVSGGRSICLAGGAVASDSAAPWTSGFPTGMRLGVAGGAVGVQSISGHIRNFRYYPRHLTNAQLQALTA